MKTKIIVFAAAMFLALAGLTIAFAQQSGQTTETAIQATKKVHAHQFNTSTSRETIPELLPKTTGDLVVWGTHISEGMGSMPNAPAYPPEKLVQMACVSDAAIVGTADSGTSNMTADQRFLLTDWTFTVEEALKNNPKAPITPGATITVTEPGGKLTIDGRNVHAIERNFRSFEKGGRYLLFLEFSPELNTYKAVAENGFQLLDDKVVHLTRQALYRNIEKQDARGLLVDARAAVTAQNPKCGGTDGQP